VPAPRREAPTVGVPKREQRSYAALAWPSTPPFAVCGVGLGRGGGRRRRCPSGCRRLPRLVEPHELLPTNVALGGTLFHWHRPCGCTRTSGDAWASLYKPPTGLWSLVELRTRAWPLTWTHTLGCWFLLFLTLHEIAHPPLFPAPQGPSDKVAPVSLQNLRFSSSFTPIRVSSGMQVQLKVRVDPSCDATVNHLASRRALAAVILVRRRDRSTLAIRSHRSWQWSYLDSWVASREWEGAPLDDSSAPEDAAWLTNGPVPPNVTSWTTLRTFLPANVCEDADPEVVGAVGSEGDAEQRRGWGTAPVATTAVLGGLLLLMSGVAAAMQMVLHRLRRLDGDAYDDAGGPDMSGKRARATTLAESLENNAETPPGTLRLTTAARRRQRPQAVSHDILSAPTSPWPQAGAASPPALVAPRGERTPPKARYTAVLPQPPPTSFTGPLNAPSNAGISPIISSTEARHRQGEQGIADDDLKRLSDLAAELATGFSAPPPVPAVLLSPKPPPLPAALVPSGPPPLPAVLFSPAPPPLPAVPSSPDPPLVPAERRHPPSG